MAFPMSETLGTDTLIQIILAIYYWRIIGILVFQILLEKGVRVTT